MQLIVDHLSELFLITVDWKTVTTNLLYR